MAIINSFRLFLLASLTAVVYFAFLKDRAFESSSKPVQRRAPVYKRDISGYSVSSPSYGQVVPIGSTVDIYYTLPPRDVYPSLTLDLYNSDTGKPVYVVNIASGLGNTSSTFKWTVLSVSPSYGAQFSVVLTASGPKVSTITTQSPVFNIVGSYDLSAPSFGTSVAAGDVYTIQFNPISSAIFSPALVLWDTYSQSVVYVIEWGVSSSETSFLWHVPANLQPSDGYTIMIFGSTQYSQGQAIGISSSGKFTVRSAPADDTSIKITSPSSQSWWFADANNTISFQTTRQLSSWEADIYCLTQNCAQYYGERVTLDLQPANKFVYTFKIPNHWMAGLFQMRFLTWTTATPGPAGTPNAAMSSIFTVVHHTDPSQQQEPVIDILTPQTNQPTYKLSTTSISWTLKSVVVDSFNIELYNTNHTKFTNQFISSIVEGVEAANRTYSWKIPPSLASSRYYYVKIWGYIQSAPGTPQLNQVAVGFSNLFTIMSNTDDIGTLEVACTTAASCNPTSGVTAGTTGASSGQTTGSLSDATQYAPSWSLFMAILMMVCTLFM